MSEQVHQEHRKTETKAETQESLPGKSETGEALKKEMDELLDEIEDVLVENAESFVRSFVQKGGE